MTDRIAEAARSLRQIVEEIDGAMNHGTWRDDHGARLKDTPEWVALYNALTQSDSAGDADRTSSTSQPGEAALSSAPARPDDPCQTKYVRADLHDAALAENARMRAAIHEASHPDFLWGALDNVHDAETTLDDYAAAASRAIRAALGADE